MLCVLFYNNAECHFLLSDEYLHQNKCCYVEYRYAECHNADCRYAECHDADCRYAECRYAECRGPKSLRSRIEERRAKW